MAHAARDPGPKIPNPCAAFRPAPPPLPARRPDAAPWPALLKDAPCPTSCGDRGHSVQCKKAPDNVMHKPSGGTYSKPEARVKLIPAEDITFLRHGKTFGRTVGFDKLEKRHCRRSITPPPGSRKVSLARSTPLTHKDTVPLSHKAATPHSYKATTPLSCKSTTPLSHKATTPLIHKATTSLAHKPMSPLTHKPTTPPPPVASCLSAKRFETAENRQVVSLNRPSPIFKAVQRGAVPPTVLQKESEMNLISPSSVHVLPAHSSKVPLGTKAEPSSKSDSTLDNSELCSTSNQAAVKSEHTKGGVDPIVEKEQSVKLSLLSPTSVLSISSTEVCPDTRSRPSSRLNLFDGKVTLASLQPETNMPQAKSPQSTTQAPSVELSNDVEAAPSTKSHIRNEQQTNQEASVSHNMSSGAQAIVHKELYKKPYQPESTTPGPCVEMSNNLDAVPSTKSHMRNERQTNQEASISCDMPSGAPLILHTEPCKKTYRPDACWKGKFEVTGELTHTCDDLEAHFPLEIFIKVYEASKQMPEVLKLEALPLSHLLPKKFKMEPPDAHDIGLCFISSHQRTNKKFDHLLEKISSHIGLRTDIGATELLIFSSKLLTEDNQTKDGKNYFCGVFRKHLRKKQHQGNNHTDNVDISNAVSFFTGSCSPDSAGSPCKSAARAPACGNPVLESPSRFSLVAPPGFTRAHCGLRTGETAESHALDVPPGYTSAHRGLHTNDTIKNGVSNLFSEKKPPIKFSLNITKPVQTDAPAGFAKLLQVKKEATEKITPIQKVDVEVDDGSEERQFPKIKRLSDILGFSSASSSNNASRSTRPRDCSQVCRSAAAVPRASKFQETGPPEKQKHCRKRGQPEPSEPSAAEVAKRLKVNGRIALNGSVDRHALNSNQAQGNGGKI